MLATACEVGGDTDDGGITLPTGSIATIEQQSANITATLTTLQTTKSAASATLASLKAQGEVTRGNDNSNNGVKTMIAALEERVAALEAIISNLQGYTEEELAKAEDWVSATFATLEQQEALANELAEIKALLTTINSVSTTALKEAIATSEASIKSWVNESLNGYCTIADMNAQIAALQEGLTSELNEEAEKLVATLTALMNDTKQEYEKAITDAIQNNGIINEQIAADIAATNKRIDEELATINKRLDDIEKRLGEIEDKLEQLIKQIQSLEYIDSNGDEPTPVVTSAEGTAVTLNFRVSPAKAASDLALNWKEYVKVKGYYLDDINTIVNLPIISYSGNGDTGLITVVASCENLSDKFYTDLQSASIYLKISDGNNDRTSASISIKAQRWISDSISLAPANNELYYITTDGNTLYPNSASDFGAKIVSNTYDYNKGCFVLKFDDDIAQIDDYAFGNDNKDDKTYTTLKYIKLPNSITCLGYYAFAGCDNLVSIEIPEGTTLIKEGAFRWCTSLESLTIPKTVTKIGTYTFWSCNSLQYLYISDLSAWCKIDFVLESELSTAKTVYANPLMKKPTLYLNGEEVVELVIPDDITEIKDRAFYGFRGTKVVLHDKITKIGGSAFAVNENLEEINLPNSIIEIGEKAFVSNKSLCSISIPNGVQSIENGTFSQCTSLKTIDIPESITSISNVAFYKCTSLESITIPSGVIEMGERVFEQCTCELIINSKIVETDYTSAQSPSTENGWLYQSQISKIILGNNVTKIGDYTFYKYTPLTNITIGNSVKEIGGYAFYGCSNLTSTTIGKGVTSIGNFTFYNCGSLASITIPDSVTSIGSNVFYGCSNLTSVIIPNGVTSIEARVFSNCSNLTSVTIGNSVTSIGSAAFNGCSSLTSVIIPNSVTSIGDRAFYDCSSLTSITIPNSVTSIGDRAFYDCSSLTSITIPNSVTSIGTYAFKGCSGELIVNCDLPNISSSSSFGFSGFTKVTFGDSVTSIGACAFKDCTELASVTIGKHVTSIGNSAFYSCTSLTSITIPNSVTEIGTYAFNDCSKLTSVTIGNSVTSIGNYAFSGCTALTSIVVPSSVTTIGKSVFKNCTGELIINSKAIEKNAEKGSSVFTDARFSSITIGNNITVIGSYMFHCYNDNKLEKVTIADSVTSIQTGAFMSCASLKDIIIPNGVTSIGSYAFSGCKSLTSITIPSSVTSIGGNAFTGCAGELIVNCDIPDGISSIGVFSGAKFTKVTIGDSVALIGDQAFSGCNSLTSLTIPNSVTSIGNSAFFECTSLTSVYCKATTPPSSASKMFDSNDPDRKIYVPTASVEAYKSAEGWSEYAKYIEGYDF